MKENVKVVKVYIVSECEINIVKSQKAKLASTF